MTFETFDQSDEETGHDQKNDNDKEKDTLRRPSKSNPRDLRPLRHLIRVMRRHDLTNKKTMIKTKTMTKTNTITKTFRKRPQRTTLETCNLSDIWLG